MNALRFRKHLNEPILELPELTSMVGKDIEIIALEEPDRNSPVGVVASRPSAIERFDAQIGPLPVFELSSFKGGWPDDERDDGFEDAINDLRRQAWIPKGE